MEVATVTSRTAGPFYGALSGGHRGHGERTLARADSVRANRHPAAVRQRREAELA